MTYNIRKRYTQKVGCGGGGGGGRDSGPLPRPLKNYKNKNIWFLSNTGYHNATSQRSMLGHHRHANETPFDGGPMMARL